MKDHRIAVSSWMSSNAMLKEIDSDGSELPMEEEEEKPSAPSPPDTTPLTPRVSLHSIFDDLWPDIEELVLRQNNDASLPKLMRPWARLLAAASPPWDPHRPFWMMRNGREAEEIWAQCVDSWKERMSNMQSKVHENGIFWLEKIIEFSRESALSSAEITLRYDDQKPVKIPSAKASDKKADAVVVFASEKKGRTGNWIEIDAHNNARVLTLYIDSELPELVRKMIIFCVVPFIFMPWALIGRRVHRIANDNTNLREPNAKNIVNFYITWLLRTRAVSRLFVNKHSTLCSLRDDRIP